MGTEILNNIFESIIEVAKKTSAGNNAMAEIFSKELDYNNTFGCIDTFSKILGFNMQSLLNVVWGFAIWLLVLKFVWKGFDNYILSASGDEDTDPMVLLVNFIKAIVCSAGFGILFQYLITIAKQITDKIMGVIKVKQNIDTAADLLQVSAGNILMNIMMIIYIICIIYLDIRFLVNGIELLILRTGISFAAVGMLDSDGGVFKPYTKKFYQICFTILLQSVCFRLSLMAMANGHAFYGIAFLVMAIKTPAFLQEFIMVNNSGGGKLQQALYSWSILRSFRRR